MGVEGTFEMAHDPAEMRHGVLGVPGSKGKFYPLSQIEVDSSATLPQPPHGLNHVPKAEFLMSIMASDNEDILREQ